MYDNISSNYYTELIKISLKEANALAIYHLDNMVILDKPTLINREIILWGCLVLYMRNLTKAYNLSNIFREELIGVYKTFTLNNYIYMLVFANQSPLIISIDPNTYIVISKHCIEIPLSDIEVISNNVYIYYFNTTIVSGTQMLNSVTIYKYFIINNSFNMILYINTRQTSIYNADYSLYILLDHGKLLVYDSRDKDYGVLYVNTTDIVYNSLLEMLVIKYRRLNTLIILDSNKLMLSTYRVRYVKEYYLSFETSSVSLILILSILMIILIKNIYRREYLE